jgi:hypothetical protein
MNQRVFVIAAVLVCGMMADASAQEPVTYPAKGQGREQMEKDKYQCYNWAKQQTGFDPMQPAAQPRTGARSGSGAARGAAGGAALGAAGGAIGGEAGKGAAIGAAAGGIIGGVRTRRERRQEAEVQQQQAAASNNARGGYNRAFAACMEGRGYTVR